MTEITVDSKYWEAIRLGEKLGTMRLGHRDYVPGPCVLVGTDGLRVQAEILKVVHLRFGEISPTHAIIEGYTNRRELQRDLADHYGIIYSNDPMTFVLWRI